MLANRAIFLDRDGVLNESIVKNGKPYPPRSLEELVFVEDAFDALSQMKKWGYFLICVTNQPDVSRGKTSKEFVEQIHKKMMAVLPLHEIKVCYHDDSDNCLCRKPKPGLLTSAALEYNINLKESIMIGDRWRDIEAGQNAGCRTILIDRQYKEQKSKIPPNFSAHSLSQAAKWIKRLPYGKA